MSPFVYSRYSTLDEGTCHPKDSATGLGVEEASCVGKDCSCYTKVFRSQIDGLREKRSEEVNAGLEKVYSQAAVQKMKELLDLDLMSSLSGGSLTADSLLSNCSFDSLKENLSCKNLRAKKIVLDIHQKFLTLSEYYSDKAQTESIKGESQCLTPMEKNGVALISSTKRKLNRVSRSLNKLSDKKWKDLLDSSNLEESLSKDPILSRIVDSLPVLKNIFTNKESLLRFHEIYSKNKKKDLFELIFNDQKLMGNIRIDASAKCDVIFKSIDTLACQSMSDFYVTNQKFNEEVFSYYPSAQGAGENSLENHLFYCESKRCENEKCSKASGFSPESFLSNLNIGSPSENSDSKASEEVERLICKALVCPIKGNDLNSYVEAKETGECKPIEKEKRDPVKLYASLGCPGGESCNTAFAQNLKIYADFWRASYRPNDAVTDDEGASGDQVRLTVRKTKRSDFVEAFVGEVGKDIEAFFAKDKPVEELAEKKSEDKEIIAKRNGQVATNKTQRTPKPVNTDFTGAGRGFGNGLPTGFKATQIPVDVEKNKRNVDTKIVRDAIDAAKDSIAEAKKWQQAYRESVNRNNNNENVVSNTTPNRERRSPASSGGTTIVNNNVVEATGSTQALLPAEATTEYQGEWNSYPEASAGGKGRAPASKTPSLVIDRSKLAELNKSLLEEFKIDPLKPFVLKVWIKEGNEKKLVEIPVENLFYNGKMILKPVKDEINSEIYVEVLNSPIFFDYRNMLAEREERRRFFKDVLPNVKKL